MPKLTKKALREAMVPLRKAGERHYAGHMTGYRSLAPEPLEWEGFVIKMVATRRARIVCRVPAPYCIYEITYDVFKDDVRIVGGWNGASTIDHLFYWVARNEVAV